jgi:hypothetical protein
MANEGIEIEYNQKLQPLEELGVPFPGLEISV